MINKTKDKEARLAAIKKKRFYTALYSCVAVMLIAAAVVGYNNMAGNKTPDVAQAPQRTPSSNAENYEPSNPAIMDSVTPVPWLSSDYYNDYFIPGDDTVIDDANFEEKDYSESNFDLDLDSAFELEPPPSEQVQETVSDIINTAEITESAESVETFKAFADSDKMIWPVQGEIVMNYSVEHLIYDPTLEQYRTNNDICISATKGTEVRAAAAGVVLSVFSTKEKGKSVTLDHGNGWTTTYSQLQDAVLVKQGDMVKANQIIGGVGSPTIYGVQLGSHIEFAVKKDNSTVNPVSVLKNS